MNADADMDLFYLLLPNVMRTKLRLNLLGTLNSVDYGGKVHQEGVTDGFDDVTMMPSDSLCDELTVDVEQP